MPVIPATWSEKITSSRPAWQCSKTSSQNKNISQATHALVSPRILIPRLIEGRLKNLLNQNFSWSNVGLEYFQSCSDDSHVQPSLRALGSVVSLIPPQSTKKITTLGPHTGHTLQFHHYILENCFLRSWHIRIEDTGRAGSLFLNHFTSFRSLLSYTDPGQICTMFSNCFIGLQITLAWSYMNATQLAGEGKSIFKKSS